MTKRKPIPAYYVIISADKTAAIKKYLSKIERCTGINSNTLTKHFSRTTQPYITNEWTVYKTFDADFKSFARGNVHNLNGSKG